MDAAPLRGRWLALGALLAALVIVAPAAADDERAVILIPAGGEVLVGGQHVLVRWTAPAAADELELMLLLDHGPTRELRLTRQLDPTAGAYLWQVPELPQRAARLRIRWGADGVETPGVPGGEFTIVAASRAAALDLHWHGGEWWLTPSLPSAVLATLPPHWGADPGPTVAPATAACAPPKSWALAALAAVRLSLSPRPVVAAAASPPARDRCPRVVPLRC